MAVKKNTYVSAELDFAETQLSGWRKYMEENPIEAIKDRWGVKEMPKGGQTWVVTASAEAQIKCVQETMSKYLQLLEVIDKLREKEEAKKVETRGNVELGSMAEEFLKGRK